MSLTSYRAAPPRDGYWLSVAFARWSFATGLVPVVDPRVGHQRSEGYIGTVCLDWRLSGSLMRYGCSVLEGLEDLAATYSPVSWDTVPWALGIFTAEFGMGSGAGSPRRPPGRPAFPFGDQ
jgi:hypothetical protein